VISSDVALRKQQLLLFMSISLAIISRLSFAKRKASFSACSMRDIF
jgi:hypothetical protein